jgi:hypothetical protein
MVVQPLEAVYAHFEQQDAHLQQAAAFGKMLVRGVSPRPPLLCTCVRRAYPSSVRTRCDGPVG